MKARRSGSVSKRCYCRDDDRNMLGNKCPRLKQSGHGAYHIRHELKSATSGERRTFRRGGYFTIDEAEGDLDKVRDLLRLAEDADDLEEISIMLAQLDDDEGIPSPETIQFHLKTKQPINHKGTVGEWLDEWLTRRAKDLKQGDIVENTWHGYESACRLYLKPLIGDIRRDRFTYDDVVELFNRIVDLNDSIIANNEDRRGLVKQAKAAPNRSTLKRQLYEQIYAMPPFRQPVMQAGQHAILRALRIAINEGIRAQKGFARNDASLYRIKGVKTKALVWTKTRERQWRLTGNRPGSVMVWRPDHVDLFLDAVIGHPLEALWHLFVKRGPRRGEACALPWIAHDPEESMIEILTQLVESPLGIVERPPKTESGVRSIPLDSETNELLMEAASRQKRMKERLGDAWVDSGRVFTFDDGTSLYPGYITKEFARIVAATDLPPVRLHDLRHIAATLMLLAGIDPKVVQITLGHASYAFTAETYTSVLDELLHSSATRLVDVIKPRVRPAKPVGHATGTPSALTLIEGGAAS